MKADGLLGCLINKLIDMKRIAFILLFLSSLSVFGQETWNTCSQTVNVIPQPSYDSTFVLSAPSRAALAKGMASWTPATSSGASYLVYTALLTQTGTDAPVATVLENTLGGTVVWSYVSTGTYRATLASAFTADKTVIPGFADITDNTRRTQYNYDADDYFIGASIISTSIIELSVVDGVLIPNNGKLTSYFFEIRVYP